MADLQTTYTMPTTPAIKFTVTAENKRSGTTVYYRLKISTAPITGASYFGYNLKCTATLGGKTVANGVTLKEASPSQWSSTRVMYLPSASGWYSVMGITSAATVSASIKFYSSQVSASVSSGSRTLSVPAGSVPNGAQITLSSTAGLCTKSVTLNGKVSSWGDAGSGKYTYAYSSDNKSWKTISTTTSKSVSFTPSQYGYTNGSIVYFRVQAVNARGLTSTSGSVKYTCASAPSVPTGLKLTPMSGKRTDSIKITWSGTTSYYEIRVRYSSDGGKSWTSWVNIDPTTAQTKTTTPSSYTAFFVCDTGILQYAVRARNTYGLYSAWSSSVVYTLESPMTTENVKIKINGIWKTAKAVYIKVNGEWKKAKKVFVKTNGTWKTKT